ncbi:MAG: hypothetical protein ACRD82_04885 [Blastocatellia bacterium]
MATRNSVTIIDAKLAAVYHAAPKTKQKKALSAFRQALQESKPAEPEAPRLSRKESELFLKISQTLPADQQQRHQELRQKREDETLTAEEHAELMVFVEEIQQIWIERLQAVHDLAKLRKVSPREMMRQLGVDPEKYG